MKKLLLTLGSALASLVLVSFLMTTTTSCKKDDTVTPTNTTPGITITSVTSVSVTLNNQNGAGNQKYVISTETFASNNNFDIAYGNGTADNNKFFIGGPTSESIAVVYTITGGTYDTQFYTSASLTAAKFDTLVNQVAIASILSDASGTGAESGGANYRIKSEIAWVVGSTFAIKLSGGAWVVAKVTAAPTGTASTAGSVGLALKW